MKMSRLAMLILVCMLFLKTIFVCGDPCNAENILRGKYRGTECKWRDGKATHDRDIVQHEHWYKAVDENGSPLSMPTKAIRNNLRCSTRFPIWMNGSNPSVEDGEVTYKACVSDGKSECDATYNIVVKNCTDFLVYQLSRPKNPDEAYCFGEGKGCPPTDPCEDIDREILEDDGYRSATCTPTDLCDKNIDGWYLVQNSGINLKMVTQAPSPGSCGAEFPIWMDGQHLDQLNGSVSRKVCVTNATHECAEHFQLGVVDCGAFFVYDIQSRSNCPQRYCFGTVDFDKICPGNDTNGGDFNNRGTPMVNVNITSFGVIVLLGILWML